MSIRDIYGSEIQGCCAVNIQIWPLPYHREIIYKDHDTLMEKTQIVNMEDMHHEPES